MTRPTDDMTQKAKAVLKSVRDGDGGRHRSLMERLGEFFPQSRDFAWLDDDYDLSVGQLFNCEDGGWLENTEDAEFWQIVEGLDTGTEGWQAPDGLVKLLERTVDGWERAASVVSTDVPDDLADGPRFLSIEPVADADLLGWWQGYDSYDEVWKYVHTGDAPPDDQTPDWVISSVAFPVVAAEAVAQRRFESVEPVPGKDYPGWWQGYDTVEQVWKYVPNGNAEPADDSPGWTDDLSSAIASVEQADEPAADLVKLLADTAAETIAEVRALGVTEEEMPDEAIVEALEKDMAAEMSAG
jgi:hypothetical protein